MKSICIFSGSSMGSDPAYRLAAQLLGRHLAGRSIQIVYGGAKVGLMGEVANAALSAGGRVIGVLPRFLQQKEIAHENLTELILCESMHERKSKMFELSDGFIALPGGFGTLEEVCEVLTWGQLGLHQWPIGFLNINGYYDHLHEQFKFMEERQLLKPENKSMALFHSDVGELLKVMEAYKAPAVTKWIKKDGI